MMYEKNEIQKEFFSEFKQPVKFKKKALAGSAAKKLHNITLSNEQIIFLVLGLIILLITCFSLGVERGKVMSKRSTSNGKRITTKKELINTKASAVLIAPPKVEIKLPKEGPVKDTAEPNQTQLPYLVQVATFKNAAQAQQEKEILEKKGYSVEIVKSGVYAVVCVVNFANKKDATKAASELKKRYKDCFIKRR